MRALALLLAACTCAPEPAPEPTWSWAPPIEPDHRVDVRASADGAVQARLRFTDVGSLIRGWMGEPERVLTLVDGLAPCVDGVPEVVIAYEEQSRRGRIVLLLASRQLTCRAAQTDGSVDLAPLAPIGRALAAYRNDLAATRDIRLYGFEVGLHVEDARGSVTLWLDGQDPIDGSAFAPCLAVDRVEACVDDPAEQVDGITRVALADDEAQRRFRSVIGSL